MSTSNNITDSPPHKLISPPKQKKPILPIIIDNIHSNKSRPDIIKNLIETFKHVTFDIKQLNKGGIVITPLEQHKVNSFFNLDKYNTEFFGNNLYIHLAGETKDLRPWLCINKIPINTDLNDIKHK